MLASTVQFSTNKQPPAPHHRQTPGSPERYDGQTGPVMKKKPPAPHPKRWRPGPAPSGPNSVPTTVPPPAAPLHAPPVRRQAAQYQGPTR